VAWRRTHLYYLDLISGKRTGPAAFFLKGLLHLFSWLYALCVGLRVFLYRVGLLPSVKVSSSVVSVGNIVLGGTGKTPLVEWLCRFLAEEGYHPVILSRGYKSREGEGDEFRLLRKNLPDVPHIARKDRVSAAREAIWRLNADVLVLDDGFSHLRLKRDIDIVILDATNPLGFGWLFPRGLLREPPGNLSRADILVLSRTDQVEGTYLNRLIARLRFLFPRKPIISTIHRPLNIENLCTGEILDVDSLRGKAVLGFCGIASPDAFRRTLVQLGVNLLDFVPFPDHYDYDVAEEAQLIAHAQDIGAEALVTTEKDAQRWKSASASPMPVFSLRIVIDFPAGSEALRERLKGLSAKKLE